MSLAQVKRTTSKAYASTLFFFRCGYHLKMYIISLGKMTSVEKCLIFIQASMVNSNGKPYLRIKIRLRVIVWWPFCDFFFINRIPALVKLTSAKRGGHDFFFLFRENIMKTSKLSFS